MPVGTPSVGAPAYEETVANNSSSILFPPIIEVGDLLLLGLASNGSSPTTFNNPAGWTPIDQISAIGDTTNPNVALWMKYATGADVTHGANGDTQAVTHGSMLSNGVMLAFPDVDLVDPLDAPHSIADTGVAALTTVYPSIDATMPGCAAFIIAAGTNATATSNPPTGWNEVGERTLTGARAWEAAYVTGLGSGPTGAVSSSWSSNFRTVGIMVLLRPAVEVSGVTFGKHVTIGA